MQDYRPEQATGGKTVDASPAVSTSIAAAKTTTAVSISAGGSVAATDFNTMNTNLKLASDRCKCDVNTDPCPAETHLTCYNNCTCDDEGCGNYCGWWCHDRLGYKHCTEYSKAVCNCHTVCSSEWA